MRRTVLFALWLVGDAALAQSLLLERDDLLGGIVGRVCLDENRDGLCSEEERGLAGQRVVLETGQYAISDADGRFHLAGVRTREPDSLGGGRMLPGRHRVALDGRSLPPGSRVFPKAATLELSMGGIALQDFAVQETPSAPPAPAFSRSPAVAQTEEGGEVSFWLSGAARPDQEVRVQGRPAERNADGSYRAKVILSSGANQVPIARIDRDGSTSLWTQRVDVVQRKESLLVIPGPFASVAEISFGRSEAPAVLIRAEPGTRVQISGSLEQVVGREGRLLISLLHPKVEGEGELNLRLQAPGRPAIEEHLVPPKKNAPFLVGLLDVEATYDFRSGSPRLFGRGALHGEARQGPWLLEGELDLRDQDVEDIKTTAGILRAPRQPQVFDRWLDPDRAPSQWGDDSVGVVPNVAEARLRLRAAHDTFGGVGFGTHRALFQDSEVGRYQRALFGPFAELRSPELGPLRLELDGFYAPSQVDPLHAFASIPAHEEFRATGGSVFYLGRGGITQGSEMVRVEYRDGNTALPLGEDHLSRGVDYEIDYAAGRILLARPLSFALQMRRNQAADAPFLSQPLSDRADPILMVDYEALDASGSGRSTAGGELKLLSGDWKASAGAVSEEGASFYELFRASASGKVGPLTLILEGARSRGVAIGPSAYGLSTDGGLSFIRPLETLGDGYALGARLRGQGVTGRGRLELAYRLRSAGFSDGAHYDSAGEQRATLLWNEPIGPVSAGVLLDDRRLRGDASAFRSDITQLQLGNTRTLGAHVGGRLGKAEGRIEVKDLSLTVDGASGGRTAVGAAVRYRLTEGVALLASHHQVVAMRGAGPGRFNDTLAAVGAEVSLPKDATVGAQVGWGPSLGVVAMGSGQMRQGRDVRYGSYSVDVDGPSAGERRLTSGVRTELPSNGVIFAEDVAAHDAAAVRLSKAVGASVELLKGFSVSARYERGQQTPFGTGSSVERNAGGISASWIADRFRLYGRAELRNSAANSAQPSVFQRLLSGAGEVHLTQRVSASGRINASDSRTAGVVSARFLEGTAGLSYRSDPLAVLLRFGSTQELMPATRGLGAERTVQSISLLPAFKLHPRVSLSAGGHVGRVTEAGQSFWVISGSLRPAVRVYSGVEVAAELARRSLARHGGELNALRGEVGYRTQDGLLLAAGYSFFGFQGTGLESGNAQRRDRIYVRAEVGF